MNIFGNKTWEPISFESIIPRKRNRRIGLSFPEQNKSLGLEPSVLTVLSQVTNAEFSDRNLLFNDDDVDYYICSVYISGVEEFKKWALQHDYKKIVVGGYHPTTFPEDFIKYAYKIVVGPCDDFFETIAQSGQIVQGISTYKEIPAYHLYDSGQNQQIIPDKHIDDPCTSINTSMGCPFKCKFCCSPIMCSKLISKPIDLVKKECIYLGRKIPKPKWIFIRDENFPLQKDWKHRLHMVSSIGAKIYLFCSANLIDEDMVKTFKDCNVYMVCLGLENINDEYGKNKNLDAACELLRRYGIYVYLSFIVNPLEIVGREKGIDFYQRLMNRFYDLKPEMICGNFLMPFRGTPMWDEYYHLVSEEDYKYYDSKSAFLIKNKLCREKMEFFMFYYQWLYYTSDFYRKEVREFRTNDTLHLRFQELKNEFDIKYSRIFDKRC
jgi:radical SAM superfamily enzyme YgiQ (UPF0313 family)